MSVSINVSRGGKVALLLQQSFSTAGIHGHTEMPEDIAPEGITKGSLEHILFITLTVSIDYQRDADALWASARQTYEDPETRYLFIPQLLHETPFSKIVRDMQKHKLSKKPSKDAHIWHTVGVTFYKSGRVIRATSWQAANGMPLLSLPGSRERLTSEMESA